MSEEWVNGVFTGWDDEEAHECHVWMSEGRRCKVCRGLVNGWDTQEVKKEIEDLKAQNMKLEESNRQFRNALIKILNISEETLRRYESLTEKGQTFSLGG